MTSSAETTCGIMGYDMACVREPNHKGKHRGVHVVGKKEPPTVWWDPKELIPIGDDEQP